MKKVFLTLAVLGVSFFALSGCAESNYDAGYNSGYYGGNSNDRQIDRAISQEMNSLSEKDIAELNKLK